VEVIHKISNYVKNVWWLNKFIKNLRIKNFLNIWLEKIIFKTLSSSSIIISSVWIEKQSIWQLLSSIKFQYDKKKKEFRPHLLDDPMWMIYPLYAGQQEKFISNYTSTTCVKDHLKLLFRLKHESVKQKWAVCYCVFRQQPLRNILFSPSRRRFFSVFSFFI
jgi:hypothetical protein